MSILKRKEKPVHDLHPIDDPHKHDREHLEEILTGISPIIVIIMVFILLILASIRFGFAFSTEAHQYEHLTQIVTNGGATCLFFKKWQI